MPGANTAAFWVSILTLALAVLTALAGNELIAANPQTTAIVAGLIAAVTAVLQFLNRLPKPPTGDAG